MKSVTLNPLEPSGLVQACTGMHYLLSLLSWWVVIHHVSSYLENYRIFSESLCSHAYLLTPWKVTFEKLTGSQLVKKFPAFYANRRFINAFTSARHLSLA